MLQVDDPGRLREPDQAMPAPVPALRRTAASYALRTGPLEALPLAPLRWSASHPSAG